MRPRLARPTIASFRIRRRVTALDEQAIQRMASVAKQVGVPSGYVLLGHGDRTDQIYVVADGTAAVIVDGRAQCTLGRGTVIGAHPRITPPPPRGTVIASTPMRFFVVDPDELAALSPLN